MLYYALIFFIIAIVAAVFGFGGIAAGAASIAKLLFFIFLVIFVVMLVMGLIRRGDPRVRAKPRRGATRFVLAVSQILPSEQPASEATIDGSVWFVRPQSAT